jgi:hypothetical protein
VLVGEKFDVVRELVNLADAFIVLGLKLLHFLVLHLLNTQTNYSKIYTESLLYRVHLPNVYVYPVSAEIAVYLLLVIQPLLL